MNGSPFVTLQLPARKSLTALALLVVVVTIGWIDLKTGPDIGFSLFYLIPIAAAAWFSGTAVAVAIGCASAISWLVADMAWREGDTAIAISAWNAFTRFVVFISEGVFIALLQNDRRKFRRLASRESALARTDSATQLMNVRGFIEAAAEKIEQAHATGRAVCVAYVDLDNFKTFNDRLGHAAGDLVLVEVAKILTASIDGGSVASRIGGDEFALLLHGVTEDTARAWAKDVGERVRAIGAVYSDIGFGATTGIVYFRNPPDDAETLLRTADDAMYRGKAAGKGSLVFEQIS